MASKEIYFRILRTCEYVTSLGNDCGGLIKGKGLGDLPGSNPIQSHEFLKGEGLSHLWSERDGHMKMIKSLAAYFEMYRSCARTKETLETGKVKRMDSTLRHYVKSSIC